MKHIRMVAMALLLVIPASAFAIEISATDSARLDITSRTSFGISLDETYRYGLSNELTQVDLVFGLAPYQKVSNRLNSPDAVGFINVTLFNLDLVQLDPSVGYVGPGTIRTNRYQTGEFLAGIAKGNWLFQLNAGANEPFSSPWNKGMEYINDGFKVSWAYLDSMVDVRRTRAISGVPVITKRGEENMTGDGDINGANASATMQQFGFDSINNVADRYGMNVSGQMIAAMYNTDNFGINLKFGTEYSFESPNITASDQNGLAAGVDTVFTPGSIPGLKVFASVAGTVNYSFDTDPDPLILGTRVGYNIPLSEDISVEPWAGLDIGTEFKNEGGATNPAYEVSFGGTMRWPGQSGWHKDYIINSDGRVFSGMSLGYLLYQDTESDVPMSHSIKFTLFEPKGDEGLFYKLGSEIIIDLVDLTDVTKGVASSNYPNDPEGGFSILATAYFDWELNNVGKIPGTLVPWTILYYDNLPKELGSDERINDFKIDLGLNLEKAVANTTFGLVWNSGSLIQNKKAGYIRLIAEIRL